MSLTDQQVREIRERWKRRPTIASLAEEYGVSTDVIRKVISLPERR